MRRPSALLRSSARSAYLYRSTRWISSAPPIINIENGTFYREYPSPKASPQLHNQPIYPNLSFSLPSTKPSTGDTDNQQGLQHWAIVGSSGRTSFLRVLQGQYIAIPPDSRSYPYLASKDFTGKHRNPSAAIQYVGFADEGHQAQGSSRGAYLSARYESRKEETDFTLFDHLKGRTSLNPAEDEKDGIVHDDALLNHVISSLSLEALLDLPIGNLSNGQTRRAKIAKALLRSPEVLLVDEPLMGLDPRTQKQLSTVLHNIASESSPRLIISLRAQDRVPDWITHLVILGNNNHVSLMGEKTKVHEQIRALRPFFRRGFARANASMEESRKLPSPGLGLPGEGFEEEPHHRRDAGINSRHRLELRNEEEQEIYEKFNSETREMADKLEIQYEKGILDVNLLNDFGIGPKPEPESSRASPETFPSGEPVVEMEGVQVKYGDDIVLGDWRQMIDGLRMPGLYWKVCRGERWGVFGPNGSGKTTLLSLITSDHPQSYSLPLKIFGRSRLPKPGQPGISIFDLQSRIGHSSPEIHAFFPRHLSIRQSVESAYADTFLSKPKLDHEKDLDVDAALSFFEEELNPNFVHWSEQKEHPRLTPEELEAPPSEEDVVLLSTLRKAYSTRRINLPQDPTSLNWADNINFSELNVPQQRVVLFIRAVIHRPDLIVLDEAFSGMSPACRDRCIHFLEYGEQNVRSSSRRVTKPAVSRSTRTTPESKIRHRGLSEDQALITISHVKEEIPNVVRNWMYLPGSDEGNPGDRPFRMATITGRRNVSGTEWNKIWYSKPVDPGEFTMVRKVNRSAPGKGKGRGKGRK